MFGGAGLGRPRAATVVRRAPRHLSPRRCGSLEWSRGGWRRERSSHRHPIARGVARIVRAIARPPASRSTAPGEVKRGRAIVSFIADGSRSSLVLATVFVVLHRAGIRVEMLSQGASKVNISLIVAEADAKRTISELHACFFEGQGVEGLNCEALLES